MPDRQPSPRATRDRLSRREHLAARAPAELQEAPFNARRSLREILEDLDDHLRLSHRLSRSSFARRSVSAALERALGERGLANPDISNPDIAEQIAREERGKRQRIDEAEHALRIFVDALGMSAEGIDAAYPNFDLVDLISALGLFAHSKGQDFGTILRESRAAFEKEVRGAAT
jgi:hypothetical protein